MKQRLAPLAMLYNIKERAAAPAINVENNSVPPRAEPVKTPEPVRPIVIANQFICPHCSTAQRADRKLCYKCAAPFL